MGPLVSCLVAALLQAATPAVAEPAAVAEWAALLVLLDAFERDQEDPEVVLALMLAQARRGDLAGARRLSDLLSRHAAYRARALLCRAAVKELLGEEEAARRDREEALDQLDVALTDRAAAERFLSEARGLLARARQGWGPLPDDDDAPLELDEMRAALRRGRGDR
ncbi:MAG: hypothetical protein JRI23_10400 [Deltaproteobacteria bacterium]|jgi:hypothetical protein|nr:hypothetical protein [Deltaproteobacteria bacterium]MBW2532079.1 hypothetical protein [Deltaproteobacteria bacterium]